MAMAMATADFKSARVNFGYDRIAWVDVFDFPFAVSQGKANVHILSKPFPASGRHSSVVHYKNPDNIHQAFLSIGCLLICWN